MHPKAKGPELAWVEALRTIEAALPAPDATVQPDTPRSGLQQGQTWSWDCARCRCSGRLDLQRLVDEGRGNVGPETMRCPNCKHHEIAVRITATPNF
jgi:hypothetical protein